LTESQIWAENVVRKDGVAIRAEMTNGNAIIAFEKRSGKVKEVDRFPFSGRRISCRDDLWMPRSHYSQAVKMARGILNEKRKKP